jgi:hypothetical protein
MITWDNTKRIENFKNPIRNSIWMIFLVLSNVLRFTYIYAFVCDERWKIWRNKENFEFRELDFEHLFTFWSGIMRWDPFHQRITVCSCRLFGFYVAVSTKTLQFQVANQLTHSKWDSLDKQTLILWGAPSNSVLQLPEHFYRDMFECW